MPARLLIEGGVPLRGEVAASAAKNAALPALTAALLTARPLTLTNVPDLGDVRTMLKLLETHGATVARRGREVTRHRRERGQRSGAVRAGLDHARLGARAGAARGALRLRARRAARWLRHRRAADRPASQGPGQAGRRDRHRERLRGGAGEPAESRTHRDRSRDRDRHREPHDGGRPRRGHHDPRERRPRAGGQRPRRAAHRDGRAPARRGHQSHRDRGRARADRGGPQGRPRSHRGRHAAGGRRHHARGRASDRHGPRPRGRGARQARGVRRGAGDRSDVGAGAGRRSPAADRHRDQPVSWIPDGHAGAADDPAGRGRRPVEDHRDDLREPLHARRRAGPDGRADRRRGLDRGRARRGVLPGRAGDGLRPPRLGRAGAGGPGRARADGSVAHLPPGPRLRAPREQAHHARVPGSSARHDEPAHGGAAQGPSARRRARADPRARRGGRGPGLAATDLR